MDKRRNRMRAAWNVWRQGLPVVEVGYRRDDDAVYVSVTYSGRCHGIIDGEEVWTNDGTFTVAQAFEFV
jgi:hypothetical protein